MATSIKGIVFDLDDTLYPQRSFKMSGFHVVAEWLETHYGCNPNVILHHLNSILEYYGPSYPFMFDQLIKKTRLSSELTSRLIQVFVQHKPTISCFPMVANLLTNLQDRYLLGLLTDGREDVQRNKVCALGLNKFIKTILYSNSLGLSKPSPELFIFFEKAFGCQGRDLIYIGDNPHKDFIGAKNRNWLTIRVLTGEFTGISVETEKDAKYTINEVKDIIHLPPLSF